MTMDTDAFLFAEIDYRVGSGATPMGFVFRIFHGIPVFRSVPEFLFKPWFTFFQLKFTPVESDGCAVENIAVQGFIFFVAFIGSQLIVVENVGTENKIVLDLFGFDSCTGFQTFDFERAIGFPVFFDIFIDLRLYIIVPTIPVPFFHYF